MTRPALMEPQSAEAINHSKPCAGPRHIGSCRGTTSYEQIAVCQGCSSEISIGGMISLALDASLKTRGVRVQFFRHEGTGANVIRVINEASGRIVREMPQEGFLDVIASIDGSAERISDLLLGREP
jgi:hypothetical protein